jgi:hypothetical protein
MSEKDEDQGKAPELGTVKVNIEREYPADIPLFYANHFLVQASPHETFLSFYQIVPPDFPGTAEEERKKLEELGTIKAKCILRIAVAREFFEQMAGAMMSHVAKMEKYKQQPSNEDKKEGEA